MVPEAPRVYRSELRAQQAAQTRARIVIAAAECFSSSGYQATTLAGIARAAGVSTETVKAAASKAELLIASFEVTFSGTEGQDSLAETDVARGVAEMPDALFLDAVVDSIATANGRGHALWTVVLGAALSDDVVAAALAGILERRAADYRRFVDELSRRGMAQIADADDAAVELSFLFSPEGYQQLVTQSGWTDARYRGWLRDRVAGGAGRR